MTDAGQSRVIQMPPRVPEVQKDGLSQWMHWHAEAAARIAPEAIKQLEGFLSQGDVRVSIFALEGNHARIKVRQTPTGDYTELYDSSLRALFYVEKQVGELLTIEGYPRSKWNTQFIFARRFGALD